MLPPAIELADCQNVWALWEKAGKQEGGGRVDVDPANIDLGRVPLKTARIKSHVKVLSFCNICLYLPYFAQTNFSQVRFFGRQKPRGCQGLGGE